MLSLLSISLFAASALIIYRYVLYPSFVSPLSKIPAAHFTASWSPLWILWVRYTDVEVQTIHKAHVKHGPIVRLGPNEVSINCVDDGLRKVYAGGFEKTFFYDQFQNYGVPNMFSTKESKPHAARKRMISNVYSKSFIQSSQEAHEVTRSIVFDRMLPTLDTYAAKGSPLEVFELNDAVTMDFICCYVFGLSNDCNFILDVDMRKQFLSWYRKRSEHSFWNQEIPGVTRMLRNIGIHMVPKWVHAANRELEAWMLGLCSAAEHSLKAASEYSEKAHRTRPIVYGQLKDALRRSTTKTEAQEESQISGRLDILVASELLDHVTAGMDTSGITLTYLFWELSRQPDLQASLRRELLTLSPTLAFKNKSDLPLARSVDALPLLHAVVMETLRRHAAIPGSQPRATPSTPTSLAGSPPLPGGVRVSAQAYSLHRNEEAFPDPEAWLPQRWLDADQGKKDEMMRWFWAFGSGGRMCVGSNFAMQGTHFFSTTRCCLFKTRPVGNHEYAELKYVTAAIYTNFTTSIVDDTGIDQVDAYTAGPTSDQLTLRFARVQ
ncbi:MAG: hypothetical protein Q9179_006080 [Wetmoreana sp. 5 TL-2023]